MTRIITIVSGKGGVGKTTMTTNIGVVLADLGYNVLVLDANLTTPNMSMHLGVPLFPIILSESAAGLGREALSAIEASDEVLVITNPDLPAVTDALKAVKLAEKIGARVLGVVVNRVKNKKHELSIPDIEDMLNLEVIQQIPESEYVQMSIAKRKPIVHNKPNDPASHRIKKIAHGLVGSEYEITEQWFDRLFKFLKK